MGKQETLITKKRRGPAPTGINPLIGVRVPPAELAGLDSFIKKSGEPIGRPEAIRRILTEYLKRRGAAEVRVIVNERESKAEAINTAARSIIAQERKAQDAKTTRLKAARLAKEATSPTGPPTKKRRGPLK